MPAEDSEKRKKKAYNFLEKFDVNTKYVGPYPLGQWQKAPMQPGVYEIGLGADAHFKPRYIGKAVVQTLQVRLGQHWRKSTNAQIRSRVEKHEQLYFRCHPIDLGNETMAVIDVIEGTYIIAFDTDYVWNARNEWGQQMAAEDL